MSVPTSVPYRVQLRSRSSRQDEHCYTLFKLSNQESLFGHSPQVCVDSPDFPPDSELLSAPRATGERGQADDQFLEAPGESDSAR